MARRSLLEESLAEALRGSDKLATAPDAAPPDGRGEPLRKLAAALRANAEGPSGEVVHAVNAYLAKHASALPEVEALHAAKLATARAALATRLADLAVDAAPAALLRKTAALLPACEHVETLAHVVKTAQAARAARGLSILSRKVRGS